MKDRIEQLEYTVMELGTELYKAKSEMQQISKVQRATLASLKGLRNVLDSKGVIDKDDIEIEIELTRLIEKLDKLGEVAYENNGPLKRGFN
jgi:hypothetical protein